MNAVIALTSAVKKGSGARAAWDRRRKWWHGDGAVCSREPQLATDRNGVVDAQVGAARGLPHSRHGVHDVFYRTLVGSLSSYETHICIG